MASWHLLGRSGEILRNFYGVKQHLSLRAFLGVGRGEGSWKTKTHGKEKLLAKVVMLYRTLSR